MSDDKYWTYEVAHENLQKRLQATEEEMHTWTYLGQADGGLDFFDYPDDNKNEPPHKNYFIASPNDTYFLREQIEGFNPDNSRRFLTLQQLIKRWQGRKDPIEVVQDFINNGQLYPINLMRHKTAQVVDAGEGALIPDLSLFALDEVLKIEARKIPVVADTQENTDSSLWATTSSLIDAFEQYGFTKKKINNGGAQWIKDARQLPGSGGRGHAKEPMFCPFAIMQGLVHKARPTKLSEERGWKILKSRFPAVYKKYSDQDPCQYDE